MTAFRVTATFDLDINDDASARQAALQFIDEMIKTSQAEAAGPTVVEGDAAATLAEPRALASTLSAALLGRGAGSVAGVEVSNAQIQSELR